MFAKKDKNRGTLITTNLHLLNSLVVISDVLNSLALLASLAVKSFSPVPLLVNWQCL
jgi:hypothetical protein